MSTLHLNAVAAALIFAVANICLKRGLKEGSGVLRSVFITNVAFFTCLLPLGLAGGSPMPVELLWAPLVGGVTAFLGAVFQVMALKRGDVSVATPLLGGKVLFVALFSTVILGHQLPLSWWGGVGLAMLGVGLLGYSKKARRGQHVWYTIAFTTLSVASFAVMDIMVAGWGAAYGFNGFVMVQQSLVLVLSLGLIPFFGGSLRALSRTAFLWTGAGSLLMVAQFYLLNWTIARLGEATVMNILYSSRGVWGVLLVYWVGNWFGNDERVTAQGLFGQRLLGALLLVGAIVCVVL